MTGPRASIPVESTVHPLRAALARGDKVHADSDHALHRLLAASDRSLIPEAVVAQVRGMLSDLARQLIYARVRAPAPAALAEAMLARLQAQGDLRAHCQALAWEWRLAQVLEHDIALDPVLSPQFQQWVAAAEGGIASLAMAALAAQARFAQSQRRMELPLAELPGELFHVALAAARDIIANDAPDALSPSEAALRADYDEAGTRLALLSRLAREAPSDALKTLAVEEAGVAMWLSVLADRSGEARDRTACAVADPHLGRLLLTLRAAGASPADAERQALRVQPDASLPRGLADIGTREAAQWLVEARA